MFARVASGYFLQDLLQLDCPSNRNLVFLLRFMNAATKAEIGKRLRKKREDAGYTRERLGELCSLSPRFIANIELGDSTFSLDSLMVICRTLSCSSDYLLFGSESRDQAWDDTVAKIRQLDHRYEPEVGKILQGVIEAIVKAEK